MTNNGPPHMNFALMMISAVKWCVLFYRKSSVLFSPKLLNSECVLPPSIAVTVNSVSIALQSYLTTQRILSSLLFVQHQSNEVHIVLLLFGTFANFVAVCWLWFFFFFKEVEIISFNRRKLHWDMCLIRICLSVKRKITANLPLWIIKKHKNLTCKMSWDLKKDKVTEPLYKKSLNIRKVKICEMHSTFLWCFLSFHIYCAFIYNV